MLHPQISISPSQVHQHQERFRPSRLLYTKVLILIISQILSTRLFTWTYPRSLRPICNEGMMQAHIKLSTACFIFLCLHFYLIEKLVLEFTLRVFIIYMAHCRLNLNFCIMDLVYTCIPDSAGEIESKTFLMTFWYFHISLVPENKVLPVHIPPMYC